MTGSSSGTQTVAALSSGSVPSGVAVIRVSGPQVRFVLETMAGEVPEPRYACLKSVHDPLSGDVLDMALVFFFPGPRSFTGEDVAEFHCHGGRAVVEGVLEAIWSIDGVEPAHPGAFTRQAFLNGKLDLTQVEAVGDLVHASTQAQRQQALEQLDGSAKQLVHAWSDAIVGLRAAIEAELDFSDEDDVGTLPKARLIAELRSLIADVGSAAEEQVSERLRSGFRVVLAGPPNAGKSTLLNVLTGRDAALVSSIPGTTRDMIEAPMDWAGLPVVLTDTAGLRSEDQTDDPLERMGMQRSTAALETADCVIWLDPPEPDAMSEASVRAPIIGDENWIRIRSKADLGSSATVGALSVSAVTGEGLDLLKQTVSDRLKAEAIRVGTYSGIALDSRRRRCLKGCAASLRSAVEGLDSESVVLEKVAEELRLAQRALAELVGDIGVEDILDQLFSRFCIGK